MNGLGRPKSRKGFLCVQNASLHGRNILLASIEDIIGSPILKVHHSKRCVPQVLDGL